MRKRWCWDWFGWFFDEVEEGGGLFFAVDYEISVKNFVTAMFRVHLRKSEHFAIGKFSADSFCYTFQIINFFTAECQPFLLVVLGNIVDINNGLWFPFDGKYLLIESFIKCLQHRVELRRIGVDREKLLDAGNTANSHVLRDFDRVGAPGSNHLFARTDKIAIQMVGFDGLRLVEEPD